MNIVLKEQGLARAGLYEMLEEQHPGYFVSKHTADGTIEMSPRPNTDTELKALLAVLKKKGLITTADIDAEKEN